MALAICWTQNPNATTKVNHVELKQACHYRVLIYMQQNFGFGVHCVYTLLFSQIILQQLDVYLTDIQRFLTKLPAFKIGIALQHLQNDQ